MSDVWSGDLATKTATVGGRVVSPSDVHLRTANRVFRGVLTFYAVLTVYWVFVSLTDTTTRFFPRYQIDSTTAGRLFVGMLFFFVIWGFIWYGVKSVLLRYFVGFDAHEIRQAFSSRMDGTFDLAPLLARHAERRIRIVDMIGRRGRFITLLAHGFYYLYWNIKANPDDFATMSQQDNLFDAVVTGWVCLAFFHSNGTLGAAFYGAQSRVMDGVLGRANWLLIFTLWAAFKFIMVPISTQLAVVFPREEFAVIFALIWGSYVTADTMAEIGGSLLGRQRIEVRGIGDVNRKSIAGTVIGCVSAFVLCLAIVLSNGLGPAWIGLAVVLSLSNSLLELYSPRGTDDFVMATANALICWAFGVWVR